MEDDEKLIHIPEGSRGRGPNRAAFAERVLAAVQQCIREEAGAVGDPRPVCGGCTLIAIDEANKLAERRAVESLGRPDPFALIVALLGGNEGRAFQ